jgi:leukotriene-A4 hydrolase
MLRRYRIFAAVCRCASPSPTATNIACSFIALSRSYLCSTSRVSTKTMTADGIRVDNSSHVRLGGGYATVTSMHVHWAVDFEASSLRGHVVLIASGTSAKTLVLDTRDLSITGVEVNGAAAPYQLDTAATTEALGTPLTVELPTSKGAHRVVVTYATASSSTALQWLSSEQTSSRKFPFLFSQCQAIHARSMLPCQDICQVKVPYSASVVHPKHLTTLMSAIKGNALSQRVLDQDPLLERSVSSWVAQDLALRGGEAMSVSYFDQPIPIPPYLVAIVVGELESRPLGPRSSVWAEPSVVEKAQWEFADTEKMIDVAVDRCGEYRWGVFDLLVLPPSFPYGGMENPCLTFVTPTLIAGDRSQTAVVAHELAHSWSGNLVTNATWEHFWINEGLTVFTETKIVQKIFGNETGAIRMEEGWQHVHDDMNRFGMNHRFTCLCPRLEIGEDPDDSFSSVPYEKGASLFWQIESVLGEDVMKTTVRNYFDTFALKTITSEALREFFIGQHPQLTTAVDWSRWFHEPGMPLFKPPYDAAPVQEAVDLAGALEAATDVAVVVEQTRTAVASWPSSKKCVFLNTLTKHRILSFEAVSALVSGYDLSSCNAEIRCSVLALWLPLWKEGLDRTPLTLALALVTEQGRMKFTRPTYRAWAAVDSQGAREAFSLLQGTYHPICAKMVARDLGV